MLTHLAASNIPVMSEESLVPYSTRKNWSTYWILDPIDGTRELVNGSGQYCTCLALVVDHELVCGWIVDYRTQKIYRGGKNDPLEYRTRTEKWKHAHRDTTSCHFFISNSFLHPKDVSLFETFRTKYPNAKLFKLGSALKFLYTALEEKSGYARWGRIMEWDVAAGAALCQSVCKKVVSLDSEKLIFNKEVPEIQGFRIVLA